MTRLYWYLRGYVQFVFTGGFAEDFINALGKLGITLPGLQRQGSDLRGVCSVGTYMQLHKAARQAGGRVRITARRGLPFFLRRLRGRWGLPMGAVVFALVLCVLSGFIWNVQVVGNNRVGTGTLETYLAQNGVAVGKPWQGAARSRLNYRLLGDFPDLAWAHINKVGATARLEVAERVDTPKTKSDREQSQWGAARRELRCTVRRLQVHRVQTGRQVCRGVYFYGLTLVPMGKDAPPMTEVTEQRRLLRLNGRALPMGSVTRTRTAYRRVEQRLTVQAATALAKAALEEKRAQELPGATIINAYVTVEVTPDTVTAVGAYTVQVQSLFSNDIELYRKKSALVSEATIYKEMAIAVGSGSGADIRIAASQAANELLTIRGVKASFTLIAMDRDVNISARSMGEVNVQLITEKLGGGGHLTMAGALLKNTDMDAAVQTLKDAIDAYLRER